MWISLSNKLDKLFKEAVNESIRSTTKELETVNGLQREIRELKEQKADIELKKNIEEKELSHLIKMKEEKLFIEGEKKRLELTQSFQQKEMTLQKEYFDKVMNTVKDGQNKMETLYVHILERLPNVNMEIKRK